MGTTLQSLALPDALATDRTALFLRDGEGLALRDGGLRLAAGGRVDLDTYFNSFFLAPWARWTALEGVALELDYQGDLAAAASKIADDGTRETPLAPPPSPERRVWRAPIATLNAETRGRLAVSLSSTTGATLYGMRFVAEAPPLRPVRLSVGICSFNRAAEVRALVAALAGRATERLAAVIVVEQGTERFLEGGAPPIAEGVRLLALEQPNYGGVGGFTRSLLEALALADADPETGPTHHVLMDDDVAAPPDHAARIAAFFAYARAEVGVGGPMLELETPWRLHEAGIAFDPKERRRSLGKGLDARERAALDFFERAANPDAHAWWCWGAPLSAFRAAGAPLNMFIKFDDIEYTHRLKRRGIETAVLPGASVWHASFANKPFDWRSYYALRNECIFDALHTPGAHWRSWAHSPIWDRFWASILRHDYGRARLLLDAAEAFLGGPETALPEDPSAEHQRVVARHRALRAAPIARAEAAGAADAGALPARAPLTAIARLFAGRAETKPAFVSESLFDPDPTAIGSHTFARFVLGQEQGELFRRNRPRALGLIGAMLWTQARFALFGPAAKRAWRRAFAVSDPETAAESFERWRSRLVFAAPGRSASR